MTLETALRNRRIVVVVGPGGVGKTSISAALALRAARNGRRTIVCTVDPAKRLATALGLDGEIGHEPKQVENLPLWATMLDLHSQWDELIARYSPDQKTQDRIRANPLYAGLSQHFIGSHGYMAMERLANLASDEQWDLIVIDTPPSRSALDFIDAPKRLTNFIGGTLLRWFAKPYAAAGRLGWRAFTLTAGPLLKMADKLLGSQLLEDLAEFVLDFQSMYRGFKKRADEILKLMRSEKVSFLVVGTLEDVPRTEVEFFCERLGEENFTVDAVIANKTIGIELASNLVSPICSTEPAHVFGTLARRDSTNLQQLAEKLKVPICGVGLLERDVSDLESLDELGAKLFA